MEGLLIGVLQVLIYIIIAAIIVYAIIWVLGLIGIPLPAIIVKLLWAVVGLIALIMLIQLLLGGVPLGPRRLF